MPVTDLAGLQAVAQPQMAEIVAVYWDGPLNAPSYYGVSAWNELPNFLDCPFAPVEPRMITPKVGDAYGLTPLPLFPDINSPTFQLTFADTDQSIRAKLEAAKNAASIQAEIYYYFPDIKETSLQWFGHLTSNREYGLDAQTVDAHSGFQSPEFLLPSEVRLKECSARVFGGKLATQADVDRSLCPYDKHLGGSQGINDPSTSSPWTYCPQLSKADCSARFGHDRFFGNYDFEARGVTVSSRFINTKAINNDSLLRYPISVVWGAKILMELPVLQFYTRTDTSNNNRGTVHVLAEVSNDECADVFNVLFNGSTSNVANYQTRLGVRGQSPTGWTFGVSNFSGRTHLYVVGNLGSNPSAVTAGSIKVGCFVHGFKNGRVYSDAVTYTKAQNNNRVWALLELYTNNRWGLGYSHSRFEIADFVTASAWTEEHVRFTLALDTGSRTWDILGRTFFDCNMQGRAANEQITDICRTGRLSVPYQYNGKYTIAPLKAATSGELAAALVFTDALGGNILRSNKDSSLKFSQLDPKTLTNTVVATFEDADNNDISRPVVCRDQNQMARAGSLLGSGGFKENKQSFPAYGVRRLEEAVKFGHSVLWFGEFDQGGIYNNLRATFKTPLREAINLRKFQVIKIVTSQNSVTAPDGTVLEYFRVLDAQIGADGAVTVTCQAYNQTKYAAFETVLTGGEPAATETGSVADFSPLPVPEKLTVSATYADGYATVTVS